MEKKFIVQFIAHTADIAPLVTFGPFVDEKFVESFIKADIEAGKKFMNEHCRGYGRAGKLHNTWILPSYGEWKILELVEPFRQEIFSEHCSNF